MSEESERPMDRSDWDQRYVDDEIPWDSGVPDAHLPGVIEEHDIRPGGVLVVGCGTGTNAIWLAEQGFDVTGVDISATAIDRAETKAAEAGVDCQFVVADFLADSIPNAPFEFVYDRGVFHVFDEADERSRFAARAADRLVADGMWHSLIGSTDGPPRETGPPRRSARDIVSAVEPHFEILELRATGFDQGRHSEKRAWVLVARCREASGGA